MQYHLSFDESIQARFERFHKEHPHVYQLLVYYALEVKRAGRKRYSIDSIFHRVRWHIHIETKDPDFKLNNNYTSRYARLIMSNVADLENFFELRELRS